MSDSSNIISKFLPPCSKGANAFFKITIIHLAKSDFADDFQGMLDNFIGITLADKKALRKIIVSLKLLKRDHKAKVNWSFLQSTVLPVCPLNIALENAEKYVEWDLMNEADYLHVCDVLKKMNEVRDEFNIKDVNGYSNVTLDYVKMITHVSTQC